MRRYFKVVLAAALCFLLSSCGPPAFVNPIGDPAKAKADPKISGLWREESEDVETFLHIAEKEDGWGDILMVEHHQPPKMSPAAIKATAYIFFPTTIDGKSYMNIGGKPSEGEADGKKSMYIIARYEATDDTLNIWIMKDTEVAAAIAVEKLKGTVKRDKDGSLSEVVVTDSTENVAKYVKGADASKLFEDKPMKFKKMK